MPFRTGIADLQRLGNAQLGDKTMLDALIPFADAFAAAVDAGTACATAWREGACSPPARPRDRSADAEARSGPALGAAQRRRPDPGAV